mgnify:FL=1|jgi:tRNA threonylcarbamoyladenosine biosynthesis protein TsaE|tara:strand:+ start:54 stop:509 length:456 start_codon:yes stop_codon:yes gene_type:complete
MQLRSLEDTKNLSKKISKIIKNGDVIFLYGEIGVGKTTFVRFFINHLEVENEIKKSDILSPTFNIVYDYEIGKYKIHHYDLYRLKSNQDILELGMFDIAKDHIKIIEWPELIELKPKDRIDILFQYSKLKDSRKVDFTGFGKWKDYKFDEL